MPDTVLPTLAEASGAPLRRTVCLAPPLGAAQDALPASPALTSGNTFRNTALPYGPPKRRPMIYQKTSFFIKNPNMFEIARIIST